MHGRDQKGSGVDGIGLQTAIHLLTDGISYTFTIVPNALGAQLKGAREQPGSHARRLFRQPWSPSTSMSSTAKRCCMPWTIRTHPQLTIGLGYAVNLPLTREQQLDVINRTFHAHFDLKCRLARSRRFGGGCG